ncbi:MAG: hypothetical protein PHX51_07250 [Clostridia bacterium]|nr:hypothetical protein [Clostridia bacterium]
MEFTNAALIMLAIGEVLLLLWPFAIDLYKKHKQDIWENDRWE